MRASILKLFGALNEYDFSNDTNDIKIESDVHNENIKHCNETQTIYIVNDICTNDKWLMD